MRENQRTLSPRQITLLILGFGVGGGILTLPSLAAEVLGASGWLLVLALGFLYTGSAWVVARLAVKFPEETIIEYSPRLLGKWLGLLFNLAFIIQIFLVTPINIRILQELVNISLLPGAPTWFVSGSYLLVLAYGASRQLDQIAQVNELLIEIALMVGFFVVLTTFQQFEPLHLLPVLSRDQINLDKIEQLVGMNFAFGSMQVVSMVVPYIRDPQQTAKATVKAALIITFTYTLFTVVALGVFGYKEAIELSWVGLELAKSVNFQAVILQRLDLILIVSWISALYTTGLTASFLTGTALGRLFRTRKATAFIWGLVPVVYYLCTKLENYFVWSRASFYVALLSLVITFIGYPLLYLLSWVKGKRHD